MTVGVCKKKDANRLRFHNFSVSGDSSHFDGDIGVNHLSGTLLQAGVCVCVRVYMSAWRLYI